MSEKEKKNNKDKKCIIIGMVTGFIAGVTLMSLTILSILGIFYLKEMYFYNIIYLLPLLFIILGLVMIKKRKWMIFFLFAGLSNIITYILVIFIFFLICSGSLLLNK